MLSRRHKIQIEDAAAFVCILPEGRFAWTVGELQLRYAVQLGKHVILFRDTTRSHLPIPTVLAGYRDLQVVDGDLDLLAKLVPEFLEFLPGQEIELIDGERG